MSNFETLLFSEGLKVKLMNIAMSKTFNKDNAFDLIQNTYLKAIENQDKFDGSNIDAWTVTILKNLFIDSTRKKTEELMGDDTPELSTNDHADEILLERDKDMCLKNLSEQEREIIALKQTSSYDEISNDLGIKSGTLRQTFSRAKEKFMKCMGLIND
jgi:RNA polymerase sigma factor (sigma-70 family)